MFMRVLTLAAVIAAESRIAFAVASNTLAIAGAPIRAVLCHVLSDGCVKGQLLLVAVIVVDREEPVTWFHVFRYLATHRGLKGGRRKRL